MIPPCRRVAVSLCRCVVQEVVQEVEDVVDASFVEELERAFITRPMDAQESGVVSMGVGGVLTRSRGSRGRDGIGARGRGTAREDKQGEQGKEAGGHIETEEDCARYRRCMRPLQVGSAWGEFFFRQAKAKCEPSGVHS